MISVRFPVSCLLLASLCALLPAHAADNQIPGETIVRAQSGETLKALVLRTMEDAGDLEHVAAENGIGSATTPLADGRGVRMRVARMIGLPATGVVAVASPDSLRVVGSSRAPLLAGSLVNEGDGVQTSALGSALLVLPDGSRVQVPPATLLRVTLLRRVISTDVYRIELDLQSGRVEAKVNPNRPRDAKFDIRTRYSISGVRGTDFRVSDMANNGSGTEVLAGNVALSGAAGSTAVPAGQGSVTNSAGRPSTPVPLLAAPDLAASNLHVQNADFTVGFGAVAGSRSYRARLMVPAEGGARVVAERVTNVASVQFDGVTDGSYVFTVRAIDTQGLEGYESTRPVSVRINNAPEVDLQRDANGTGLLLTWNGPPTGRYVVELAQDPSFASPVQTLSVNGTNTRIERPGTGLFYVRVRLDQPGSNWSDPRSIVLIRRWFLSVLPAFTTAL
jgi:hypothetical protein